MASATQSHHHQPQPHHHHNPINHLSYVFHTTPTLSSFLLPTKTTPSVPSPTSKVSAELSSQQLSPLLFSPSSESTQNDSSSSSSPLKTNMSSSPSGSGFPSTVRISGLSSAGKGGGPAFVGQVFSMCDLSGTGLMAVSTHFDIPFISKRTPEWLKKVFASVTKGERNGPVFRFFMDLGDAVSYVKRLDIPSGVVGACRLDLAYEHFKEKPHMFQFVPNERQVKEANKLLKKLPNNGGTEKVQGVPVFSAQNLDIAIATTDGIKWYTPYFFDKSMLDNILEDSSDQHFHSLIQNRHMQRRRDIGGGDDNLAAGVVEEMSDNVWEPPEVQEAMDEMGHSGVPLSVLSKAAEIQLLYAVDKVLLGNRWLRKAAGIQPKFPYMVDSFEKRSEASVRRALKSFNSVAKSELEYKQVQRVDLRLPFRDWLGHLWPKQPQKEVHRREEIESSPFIPKITMVGISTGEAGQMSKTTLKKTMDELTKELERIDQGNMIVKKGDEDEYEERDPLFVANVGDYNSSIAANTGSARWVRGRTK